MLLWDQKVSKNPGAVAWTMLPPRNPSSLGLLPYCPAPGVVSGTFFPQPTLPQELLVVSSLV